MLEPVEYLAYVYYKCSKCNEVGSEVRLRETVSGIHVCMFCNNIDSIEHITGINFNYAKCKEAKTPFVSPISVLDCDKVMKSVVQLGWGKKEAKEAISEVLNETVGDLSIQELLRLVIIKLDEKRTTSNETD